MSRRTELCVGLGTGVLGCLWAWISSEVLVTSDSAVLQVIYMAWVILHLPLHVALTVLDPPRYLDSAIFDLGVFLQWFLIGWLGYKIREKLRALRPN